MKKKNNICLNIDDFIRFEPVSKAFLDYHFRYVRTTEQGLLQYNNALNDKYFFEKNNEHDKIEMYNCSFIIKSKR